MKTIIRNSLVMVPSPNISDIHIHEFIGRVIDFRNGNALVKDQDDDVFEIETDRLSIIQE